MSDRALYPIPVRRKFLVADVSVLDGHQGFPIVQGYLARGSNTVKVRTFGGFAFLTVVGSLGGADEEQFEYPIPTDDAAAMLERHCAPGVISKTRHLIPHGYRVIEVDRYLGKLAGLVIAEVGAAMDQDEAALPSWLGMEVTEDDRFGEFSLAHSDSPPELGKDA